MPPFLRDNPILWHFAPWKSRGARGRLFWMMLLAALALPVLGFWILGEGSPLELLNPGIMKARDGEGFFSIIGQIWNFPVLNIWVWWAVLPGFSIVTAILAVAAIYLLRLDLLRMGLLEQVYLTGLDRNRAALGTVAWGGLVALIILASGFVFQVVFLAILYPVSLGQTTYQQVSSLNWQPVPQFETLPFSVGYACVLLAASLAVWCQALRGALRQASTPWFEAPRCLSAGAFVTALILLGVVLLDAMPRWYGNLDGFTRSLIVLSVSIIGVMLLVQFRTFGRIAGRICFGPVNPELFARDDWWESERAHRKDRIIVPRATASDWIGQVVVSLSGVALAIFVLSIVAMNIDLREMTTNYPYVVALLGIYAPAAIAVFEAFRGPLGNHRPVRGRLIRSVMHGALPMLISVAAGLAFFLWISAGLNDTRYNPSQVMPWITVAFGAGFCLFAHVMLVPRRGRRWLLGGAGFIAIVLLTLPLGVGGLALFGIGLASLCSLPTGLMSVLFQRIHDDLPNDESSACESLVEAQPSAEQQMGTRISSGAVQPR